ncbi:YybH family protein [Rhodococcus qingshengii]|uniref:YybH family protein n=1 Tax=Rhodococcus qingshengii TaxID=334542 RepID=UPI0036D8C0E7
MTHARTPADLHLLFGGALERRDLEALISLFDDEAVLDMGGKLVSGQDNLRDALSAYLALDLTMEISTRSVHESGGIALLARNGNLRREPIPLSSQKGFRWKLRAVNPMEGGFSS